MLFSGSDITYDATEAELEDLPAGLSVDVPQHLTDDFNGTSRHVLDYVSNMTGHRVQECVIEQMI